MGTAGLGAARGAANAGCWLPCVEGRQAGPCEATGPARWCPRHVTPVALQWGPGPGGGREGCRAVVSRVGG